MENLKFKGTEGQWRFNKDTLSSISPNGQFTIKAGEAGTPVAILPLPIGRNGDRQLANAKLMAAAPELLISLQYCLKALKAITILSQPETIITAAENAIEKALK